MLNKTMIIGNLGAAPEVRVTPGGTTVATLSVATSETWTNKESGKKEKSTEWHRVIFFNRLADVAKQYLNKGSLVYVEGRLRTRKWQDDKGNDRYTTEIIGSSLKMLDSKNKQYTDRMLTEDELDSEGS